MDSDETRAVARVPKELSRPRKRLVPDRFLIGLQWHPEKLVAESELQK